MRFGKFFGVAAGIVTVLVLVAVVGQGQLFAEEMLAIEWETGNLFEVSATDASLTLVGETDIMYCGSLAYRPSDGQLYGFTTGRDSMFYRIDPNTAAGTAVGPLGIDFVFEGALLIGPDETAYGTNQDGSENPILFSIDLNTGAATTIGTIGSGSHDINGLALRDDGKLVGLDRITNSLLEIDPVTTDSSVIADLSPTVGSVGGMTVVGGRGYFATAGSGHGYAPGSNELFSFDLYTGEHEQVGSFAPTIDGFGISGLARIPEPSSAMLLATAALGLFMIRRRRKRAA